MDTYIDGKRLIFGFIILGSVMDEHTCMKTRYNLLCNPKNRLCFDLTNIEGQVDNLNLEIFIVTLFYYCRNKRLIVFHFKSRSGQ